MNRSATAPLLVLSLAGFQSQALAQQGDAATRPFEAGTPITTTVPTVTYGSFRHAESIVYDAGRDVYLALNQGVSNSVIENDGYVSILNPNGSVHTLKWIGVNRNGLTLNDPRGSYIRNGLLYVADNDHLRWFDLDTGAPAGQLQVAGSRILNDLQVAADGTIYVSDTGGGEADSWRLYRVTPNGEASILVQGAPLSRPNGMHFDADGNIVVVNMGDTAVLTFSPSGELIRTEQTTHTQNDGLVITADGTKYISSLAGSSVTRIRPGQAAEVIAEGILSAASIAYDPTRNRLIIPQNQQNAVTFLELDN